MTVSDKLANASALSLGAGAVTFMVGLLNTPNTPNTMSSGVLIGIGLMVIGVALVAVCFLIEIVKMFQDK
ncbi:MAG: hypothetical protein WCW47_01680 [Candidatus Paceibacterota bacterium]|jgi:uncharacterized membrane protein (DUF485 family)